MKVTQVVKHILSVKRSKIPGVCMTCTEMAGSGTFSAQNGSLGAVAGTALIAAGQRFAVTAALTNPAMHWVFVF